MGSTINVLQKEATGMQMLKRKPGERRSECQAALENVENNFGVVVISILFQKKSVNYNFYSTVNL